MPHRGVSCHLFDDDVPSFVKNLLQAGRSPSPWDDTRAHEPLATGGTPLGMGLPTLGTHLLPVHVHRDHHRRLPERRAAQRQSRGLRRMVEPIAPHGPRLGYGHMQQTLSRITHIDQKVVKISSSQRYSLVEDSIHKSVFLLKGYRIVFSYHQVQEHPKLFLAMTGLTQAEFDQLLPHFQCAWEQYVQQHYVDRDDRQRQYGAGRSESTLVHIEDKLLFILYYVKVYPLQKIFFFHYRTLFYV